MAQVLPVDEVAFSFPTVASEVVTLVEVVIDPSEFVDTVVWVA